MNPDLVLWPPSAKTPPRCVAPGRTGWPTTSTDGDARRRRGLDTGRRAARLPHRAVVARTPTATGLTALAEWRAFSECGPGRGPRRPTAFLFTGQGSQRAGMGRGLYARFPVYAAAYDAVCDQLDLRLDRPVQTCADGADLNQTMGAQAGLFAVEAASFRLLESWGVTPDYLLGHSIGEVAAAHCAGILPLEDACTSVAARGRRMEALPEGGAMLALQATENRHLPMTASTSPPSTAPHSIVISGDADAIDEWTTRGFKHNQLKVSHAFHSRLMEPMLDEFAKVLETLSFAEPQIPIVSGDMTTPGYWVRQVRETVRFADGVTHLRDQGVSRFVELGPDGVLCGLAQQSVDDGGFAPLMRRDRDEREHGADRARPSVDDRSHGRLDAGPAGRTPGRPADLRLPAGTLLAEDRRSGDRRDVGTDGPGRAIRCWARRWLMAGGGGVVLTGRLTLASQAWLADHAVLGRRCWCPARPSSRWRGRPVSGRLPDAAEARCRRRWCSGRSERRPGPGAPWRPATTASGGGGDPPGPDGGDDAPWAWHAAGWAGALMTYGNAWTRPCGRRRTHGGAAGRVLRRPGGERLPATGRRSRGCGRPGATASGSTPSGAATGHGDRPGRGALPALLDAGPARQRARHRRRGDATAVRVDGSAAARHRASMLRGRDARRRRVAIQTADATGAPVASVESLVMRAGLGRGAAACGPERAVRGRVGAAGAGSPRVVDTSDWAFVGEDAVGPVMALPVTGRSRRRARAWTAWVLGAVQEWLAEERFADSRLVVLTRDAMPVGEGGGRPRARGGVGSGALGTDREPRPDRPDRLRRRRVGRVVGRSRQ